MTNQLSHGPFGRRRSFEPEAALEAALDLFWCQGYEATLLDELTAAMGLSRSSFYSAFGSKHAVLIASVRVYVDRIFTAVETISSAEPDAVAAIKAMVTLIASPRGGARGCLFVNSVTKLAPKNREVADLAQMQLSCVTALIGSMLGRAGSWKRWSRIVQQRCSPSLSGPR